MLSSSTGWEPVRSQVVEDRGSPVIEQVAFADFVAAGEFDHHLWRMRPHYQKRRDALLNALRAQLPDLEPAGVSAGLHVVTWLPDHLDESAVVTAALSRGLGVYGLDPYWMSPGRSGLLFGYGSLSERSIIDGVSLLASTVAELRQVHGRAGLQRVT
jgi:GntR family transcriptional regulator/MocR family aminotransferase